MSFVALGIGAFYVFAGVIVLRALRMERLLDQAIGAIGGTPADPVDALRLNILSAGGVLTLASGAALALLSPLAPYVFAANLAVQGGYLLWAERAVPVEAADEVRGRRQTKNAFVIYLAATAFVIWLLFQGVLRSWQDLATFGVDVAVIAGACAACWAWLYMPRGERKAPTFGGGDLDGAPEVLEREARVTTRLRFAPEWQTWPLWDADTDDNLNPYELGLPLDLIERIELWDRKWQATYDGDDPAASGYRSEADLAAHREEGRQIAVALRAAWSGEFEVSDDFRA